MAPKAVAELLATYLVGTERCKVFVEGDGAYRATFADYADAGGAAGDLVREIIEARMPDLMPSKKRAP
jgi:hypothetical protein